MGEVPVQVGTAPDVLFDRNTAGRNGGGIAFRTFGNLYLGCVDMSN